MTRTTKEFETRLSIVINPAATTGNYRWEIVKIALRSGRESNVPKDPKRNIQNYQLEGGHLNEFEFQKNQSEMAADSQLPFTDETDKPKPTEAMKRIAVVTAEALRKVEKRKKRGRVKPGQQSTGAGKRSAKKVARKSTKKATRWASTKKRASAAVKRSAKKVATKSTKKATTRAGTKKRARVKTRS
jgi:hypothetical protein